MNIRLIVLLILTYTASLFAQQNDLESIVKSEARNFERSRILQKVQYPGDSTIDVTYYKLELNITQTPGFLSGATTIGIRSLKADLNVFFLDLQGNMKADSVVMDGTKLTFGRSESRLLITLPRPYKTGEVFLVKVYYQGNPSPSGFGSYADTDHNGERIVWTLSEPYGAKDWFVCKDTPGDKADSSDVWVTCPAQMKVASNGTLMGDSDNGNGTHTVKWKNHYPIAHYLISIALTNYTVYTNYFRYSQSDSMPVTHFVFPESFNEQSKREMDATITMLQVFSDKFGLYPFITEKYGHAQFTWGGGMEHQTITSIANFSEVLVSHELAHQWFGDKITCARWEDIWLNEGFAEYSTAVYFEEVSGKDRYNNYITNEMNRAKNATGSIYVQNTSTTGEIFNGNRTYAKGAVVLHMLRGVVGDSVFFQILRAYLNDSKLAYNVAVTADFQAVAERVYGQSLQYFFNEWIYGENYPQYSFNWSSNANSGNIYQLSINLVQQVNTRPAFFTMPVQFKISTNIGDTIITVMNNAQSQEFSIAVNGAPTAVSLDPNNWILKNINFTRVDNGYAHIDYRLEQNYPNPFNPGTKIKFQIAGNKFPNSNSVANVTLKVFDMLGREVATLLDELRPSGEYEIEFDAEKYGLSSGIYYYELKTEGFIESKKMLFLK